MERVINEEIEQSKIDEYRKLKNTNYVYRDIRPLTGQQNNLYGLGNDFDLEAVKNSIKNIFTINKGETPGKPEYGTKLNILLFDIFDDFADTFIEEVVRSEINMFDPRIEIINIESAVYKELNRAVIIINYSVYIDSEKIYDSLYLPFSHNDMTYLGGREQIQV